ncbi:DNA internalization-related competence protein ComEC/Rec2 [Variovorax sp. PAMC 28711]|uniref:DNA internalization-related competence protein ComEC/Rec2 n=1 Tax=Variovorax sp. PAMC 28711 TaxID=1795631 RepID=UPI00078D72AA|nr:DNA internalization-related competence protein ComEC/Rec2 [Variovorax sp. PAMC 28711]AMM23276.1 competence protein ComEC [Variovorax sp. PAMC 28711]
MSGGGEPGTAARGRNAFAALAGSVLGAVLQLHQPRLWDEAGYAVLLAVGFAGLFAVARADGGAPRLRGLAVLFMGLCIGAGSAGWRAAVYAQDTLTPALEGRDVQVVGVVAQMPQRGEGGTRFRLDVTSARWADRSTEPLPAMPPRIALGWYAANTGLWGRSADESGRAEPVAAPGPLHAGERWRMTVRLKAPHGNLNPHGHDYELWAWEQGVQATGYVRNGAGDAAPERVADTWLHPVERARESVRDAVFERVADRKLAGVIAALVTGDQNAIDRADWDVFRATGVAHLMSISGLHITMFAWLAALAVGTLWRRSVRLMLRWPAPHAALAGGVLLAALYALFSGWGVPSQRTVWMLAVVALLRLSGRRWPWPHVWLLVCAMVVMIDPWALMQAGFWLSFVAVGVLFATDSGAPRAGRTGAVARLLQMFREQWVVTLALTPLGVLLFQQVSAVGLVANAVAIPWVTLVVTPLAMLGVAVPALWQLAAYAVQGLALCLQWLAGLPFATLSMPAPPLWMAVCGVAGGVLLAMRLPGSLRTLGLPLLLPVLLWQTPRPPVGEFELLAADIGQGNAVLVRTARHSLLYDTGPRYNLESDAGHRVLGPLLRAMGERLDTVVLSHRDSDHTGGAQTVLTMQPQAVLLSSIEATHPLQALRPGDLSTRCEAGQHWHWDGVDFEILHPLAADYATATKPNAVSCVLRIANGRATALLVGDIEREQEAALVARGPGLQADVLLAPHHGSKTSSSAAFLNAVKPRIAIAQVGYRNRFGHPADEVLQRYRERDIRVFDSPHCGAFRWSSAVPEQVICQREEGRRYWHHAVP